MIATKFGFDIAPDGTRRGGTNSPEHIQEVADAALAGRPAWVREGAAIYFAGERAVPGSESARPLGGRRVSCPGDAELSRPASPGALSNAYARAGACFAKQIGAGKKWMEIR